MPFNINASKNPYPTMDFILKELESRSNKLYALNALDIAKEAGHILSLNMVMLGGAAAVPDFPVEKTLLKESMEDNLPEKSLEINYKAFNRGFDIVNSK
jgi:indolepyruvate ferredoxin oxidoreductase beta subunit